MPQPILSFTNLSQLMERYDTFLIDLWGVIHDGAEAYDGAAECLYHMKNAGKKLVFISNAPRRATLAVEGLRRVGVPDDAYHHVVTSGEVTFRYVTSGQHDLGRKYMIIGPDRDDGLLMADDRYEKVDDLNKAHFVVLTGFEQDDSTLEEVQPLLHEMRRIDLPVLCANPDLEIVRKTGVRALCAGVMAEYYASLGGETRIFGKPHAEIYQLALDMAGETHLEKVAAIGDNLLTDIKGGNQLGVDSYLIAGGILGEALGIVHGELPDTGRLSALCEAEGGICPYGVLPAFLW